MCNDCQVKECSSSKKIVCSVCNKPICKKIDEESCEILGHYYYAERSVSVCIKCSDTRPKNKLP